MLIESWIVPVLRREHDWRAALARLDSKLAAAPATPQAQRAAVELGRAFEYIEPDRRCALAAYERAGGVDRACDIAIELGWWAALARASLVVRQGEPDPRLIIDEAEAWWDAGHPELCALALAGLHDVNRTPRSLALSALLAGRDLEHHASAAAARASEAKDGDANDYTIAARLALAANRPQDGMRWLEAAMLVQPGHSVAARMLLTAALDSRDRERLQRYLRLRLEGLDTYAWLDNVRACAIAMIDSEHHKGFGLRLLRQALERAYESPPGDVPGHLAMWTLLAARSAADGTRRELLPLVIRGIEWSPHAVDHVWLGALATEISLRDGDSPVVAGAYAEIVAEYAPDHPVVRELVASVATASPERVTADEGSSPLHIPTTAVIAATQVQQTQEPPTDLDEVYAQAAGVATFDADVNEISDDDWHSLPMVKPVNPTALLAASGVSKPGAWRSGVFTRPLAIGTLPPTTEKPGAKGADMPRKGAPAAPVLAALRTAARPSIPPQRVAPPDATDRARRIAVPIDVRLHAEGGAVIEAHSRDVSTTGLFVITTATLEIGDELAIDLRLPGKAAFTEDEYRLRVRVVRKDGRGYGLVLIAPSAELIEALAAL